MADDRYLGPTPGSLANPRPHRPPGSAAATHRPAALRWILGDRAPNSAQVVGLLTLVITGGFLLLLTGLTVAAAVLGLVVLSPLLLLSSPIWVPLGIVLFLVIGGLVSFFGFGLAAAAGGSWVYRYLKGRHPPGSDRVDYARSRIADTASHLKDYARGYGGNLQGKVKDAAPGA